MFTGLIECLGKILELTQHGSSFSIKLEANLNGLKPGDSLAVNGVCLTLEEVYDKTLLAYISAETNAKTNFSALSKGTAVNLEQALPIGGRLAGHLVTGHIDGVAKLESISRNEESLRLRLVFPEKHSRYIAPKGSIALDGISLTVNDCSPGRIEVNIIPSTQKNTTISEWRSGRLVNMETDILAKYLETLLQKTEDKPSALSYAFLREHGF